MKQELTLEELFKAGAHFGHRVSRWNPKMSSYIFTVRNKFHIIDLEKTLKAIKNAAQFITDTVKGGGTVLFVGTKRQSKDAVKREAQRSGSPFVVTRWLGGTLTNFRTIQRSIKKLVQQEDLLKSPEIARYTKKEQLMIEREYKKNTILFEGLRDMKKLPEAIFVADAIADIIAVREARAMKVKIIGVTDTNADPTLVDYPIPANDDAIKAIDLITTTLAEAVTEGRGQITEQPDKK